MGRSRITWRDLVMMYEESKMEQRKLDRIDDGLSKHVKRNMKLSFLVLIVMGAASIVCMYLWPGLWGADPKLLVRWTVQKIQHVSVFGMCLTIWVEYWDWKSNGNIIGSILQNSIACAVFLGLFCLAGAIVFIYV